MSKKILTLEQLVKFCETNQMYRFSSEETGYKLCVQIPSVYEKFEEKSTESMLYGKVKLLHTNRNRNGSNVTYDAATKCMSSIKYKPLLANFCEIDGVKDFTSHDMEIDEDGNIEYLEHQIGCFTVDEPYLEYDEEKDRHYLYAYVAIPTEYTAAKDIIERKGGTKVSAELAINTMSYDAQSKELLLEDIEVMAATCLGVRPETGEEVQEGMEGARLDIADFSAENNSVKFEQNDEITKLLQELNDKVDALSSYTKDAKEGGKDKEMNKFEELLEKYNKTIEDITFEYEGLSDEELETKFSEVFGESVKKIEDDDTTSSNDLEEGEPQPQNDEPEEDPVEDEPSEESVAIEDSVDNGDEDESVDDVDNDEPTDETGDEGADDPGEFKCGGGSGSGDSKKKKKYTLDIDGVVKEFSISMNAKIEALSTLVNDTYADDMTWYCVEAYDDDKNVVMIDCWSGKAYRQSYKCKDDVFSLKGDRIEVFSTWMSADERKAFDSMKSNFEEMTAKYEEASSKLAKYEEEPSKIEILESEEYSSISDKEEFVELKKQENHFDLSIDELKTKADEIILSYAKKGALNFASEKTTPAVGVKTLASVNKKPKARSRYGGLGKKKED